MVIEHHFFFVLVFLEVLGEVLLLGSFLGFSVSVEEVEAEEWARFLGVTSDSISSELEDEKDSSESSVIDASSILFAFSSL